MQHLRKGRKFGRVAGQRSALLRSLAAAFITKGRITTTEARAKELRTFIEPLISKARSGNLSSKKAILETLPKAAANKVVNEVGPKFNYRPGGYVRLVKLGRRKSDGAPMALVEFVEQ